MILYRSVVSHLTVLYSISLCALAPYSHALLRSSNGQLYVCRALYILSQCALLWVFSNKGYIHHIQHESKTERYAHQGTANQSTEMKQIPTRDHTIGDPKHLSPPTKVGRFIQGNVQLLHLRDSEI